MAAFYVTGITRSVLTGSTILFSGILLRVGYGLLYDGNVSPSSLENSCLKWCLASYLRSTYLALRASRFTTSSKHLARLVSFTTRFFRTSYHRARHTVNLFKSSAMHPEYASTTKPLRQTST